MTDSFSNSVSIIIPTLNEEENILPLVSEIAACAVPFQEILFVDDDSTDATCDKIRALAESHPIRLIEQDGAGPGLATAIMSGAQFIMPVHHQTFRLSFEPLREPIERFQAALSETPERIALREIGETFVLPQS